MSDKHIVIVGAGLVGTLNAILLAKRDFKVSVYEKRQDPRKQSGSCGRRTTNLALSSRGMKALRHVGLAEEIAPYQVPMFARMVHEVGGRMHALNYGRKEQFILSTQRNKLNEILLNAAEKFPNVTCFFGHKLIDCDLQTGNLKFLHNGGTVHVQADVVFGNDGAHSTIRRQMMTCSLMDVMQSYVPYGYIELPVAKTKHNEGKSTSVVSDMEPISNGNNKVLALPHRGQGSDHGRCCTRHATFPCTRSQLRMCQAQSVLRNTGFEDCMILNDLLDLHRNDFAIALPEYSRNRKLDAHAVCDLTLYNFLEMRQLVNTKTFRLKKRLDNLIHTLIPNHWVPLYSMVAFTDTRYHLCKKRKQQQNQILNCILVFGTVVFLLFVTSILCVLFEHALL
ncbi:kynurenine 3-monooxygenase-like isoform X2 [Crassostrea virginica]